MNTPNFRGDTPLSMLQSQLGSLWITPKVAEKIKEASHAPKRQNICQRIVNDKVNTIYIILLQLCIKISNFNMHCFTAIIDVMK